MKTTDRAKGDGEGGRRTGTAILQARMASHRLPGKVLKEIAGRPMLWYTVSALKKAEGVGRIVLATTDGAEDDLLADFADRMGLDCFRGSGEDVLDRYYQAAIHFPDAMYFRATGDNPILETGNPIRSLHRLIDSGADYSCEIGMPLGTVVECFTGEALLRCHREAFSLPHREHVTLHMKENPGFRAEFSDCPSFFRRPELRLTVDYPEDLQRIRKIIENLPDAEVPTLMEVLTLLDAAGTDSVEPVGLSK